MEKDIFDEFLQKRNPESSKSWISDYNKKKCPECFALHDTEATKCTVCDWSNEI